MAEIEGDREEEGQLEVELIVRGWADLPTSANGAVARAVELLLQTYSPLTEKFHPYGPGDIAVRPGQHARPFWDRRKRRTLLGSGSRGGETVSSSEESSEETEAAEEARLLAMRRVEIILPGDSAKKSSNPKDDTTGVEESNNASSVKRRRSTSSSREGGESKRRKKTPPEEPKTLEERRARARSRQLRTPGALSASAVLAHHILERGSFSERGFPDLFGKTGRDFRRLGRIAAYGGGGGERGEERVPSSASALGGMASQPSTRSLSRRKRRLLGGSNSEVVLGERHSSGTRIGTTGSGVARRASRSTGKNDFRRKRKLDNCSDNDALFADKANIPGLYSCGQAAAILTAADMCNTQDDNLALAVELGCRGTCEACVIKEEEEEEVVEEVVANLPPSHSKWIYIRVLFCALSRGGFFAEFKSCFSFSRITALRLRINVRKKCAVLQISVLLGLE